MPPATIALRRSPAVCAATLAFALVAALGLHAVLAPLAGGSAGLALSLAGFAVLVLAALAHARRQPAALGLEPGGVAAYDREGGILLRGPITGCAQWANRLLVIAVKPAGRARAASLLVAADALDPETFRALAVRVRHAAHRHL